MTFEVVHRVSERVPGAPPETRLLVVHRRVEVH